MTQSPSLRCFECGAAYSSSMRTCPTDGAPLCPETVGTHWKIEGVLAPNLGGGVFAAFHLKTGARAAVTYFPASSATETATADRLSRQLTALRLLDKNRGILAFIEEGSTPDGGRFLIHELGTLRLLQDLIDEWQHPDRGLLTPPVAAQLVRPLLSTLSTAHRIGVAHRSLTALDVYLTSEGDPVEGISRVVEARVHGLLTFQMGPELRQAVAADLRAVGAMLFELILGRRPPDSVEALRAFPLPPMMNSPVGKVTMRALGGTDQPAYLGAEEMLRALLTTVPTVVAPPALDQDAETKVDPDPIRRKQLSNPQHIENVNNKPTVPIEILQIGKAMPSEPFLPEPLPSGAVPVRSGLTAELHEVSMRDLLEDQKKKQTPGEPETLARSVQHRPSSLDIPPMPPPPNAELPQQPSIPGVDPPISPVSIGSEDASHESSFGQEETIPAVVNASQIAASVAAMRMETRASNVSQRENAVVSISGSMPKPLAPTGSLVIPPQPSGPVVIPSLKPSGVSGNGPAFPSASLPARPVSRPPIAPVPTIAPESDPTPVAQPSVDPEGTTEKAPALKIEQAAVPAGAAPEQTQNHPPAPLPAGSDLPPWVWAAVLAVVCLLALLAGVFGR